MGHWDACALEASLILRWIECHPAIAGWAQAVGTFVAIGFAYWLGKKQITEARRQEDEKQLAKAKALALLIAPRFADVILELDRLKDIIAGRDHGMALVTPAVSTWQAAADSMTLHVSGYEDLLMRVDALPAGAASQVVRLFSFIEDFNNYVTEFLPQSQSFSGEMRAAFIQDVDKKLVGIAALIEPIKSSLDSMTDAPEGRGT